MWAVCGIDVSESPLSGTLKVPLLWSHADSGVAPLCVDIRIVVEKGSYTGHMFCLKTVLKAS